MDAPKSVSRAKRWSAEVEEAYRFQLAGYKDENEYINVQRVGEVLSELSPNDSELLVRGENLSSKRKSMVLGRDKMDNIFLTCDQSNFDGITTQDWNQPLVTEVERWPVNGYVKKLKRRDGNYYYFNKSRECSDSDVHRTKLYAY